VAQNGIHIGLVEDQFIFREGMKSLIQNWPNMSVIFESGDGHSVIEKLKQTSFRPDVLLIDFSLPPLGEQEFNGLDVIQAVTNHFPDIKILMLSIHDDENFIAKVIEYGAHGHLVKESDPDDVRKAIHAVHEKGSYINEKTLRAIQHNMGKKIKPNQPYAQHTKLTKREQQIVELICLQHTTEEIAEKLFISTKTVNGHRINLLQKTNSRNTAGLVIYAVKNQLVSV
jgi:DNA-binding NarL/FixJ family response regulator